MLQAFTTPRNRRITMALLGASVLMMAAAYAVGSTGRREGNFIYVAAVGMLILAFSHPWRRVREYKHLFYASGIAFAVFVLLHNFMDLGAGAVGDGFLHGILRAVSIGSFVLAVFICPPVMLFALVGMVVMFVWTRVARGWRLRSG